MYHIALIDMQAHKNIRALKHGDGNFEVVLAQGDQISMRLSDLELQQQFLRDLSEFLGKSVALVAEKVLAERAM